MKWYKKLILAFMVIRGALTCLSQVRETGALGAFLLPLCFVGFTYLLCKWASGRIPAISTLLMAFISMIYGVIVIAINDVLMSLDLNVGADEVFRVQLLHKPFVLAVMFFGALISVFIWKWLFKEVREKNAVVGHGVAA